MNYNKEKSNYIGNNLVAKNGVIVNSGTMAIVAALKLSDIKQGDNVLINGYCCYSLFEAVMTVGANPVFIVPKKFFNITYEEIDKILKNNKIDCYIATHQYGIVQDIKKIKENYPDLKIIEDIAQAWNVRENEYGIGKYSDYVVTSFGKTKPLSYGQAGAVFSKEDIQKYFDYHDSESRNSDRFLLPFALYECESIDEINLIKNANHIVKKQREISKYLTEFFINNDNVEIYEDCKEQQSVWQRFPVIIKNKDYISTFEKILNSYNILFQWQNEKEVWELDMVKKYNPKIFKQTEKPIYAIVRTRQNNIKNVKRLVRSKK